MHDFLNPSKDRELHFHIHVHLEQDPRIDKILTAIEYLSKQVTEQEIEMAADLTGLTNEVTNNTTVVGSALVLIQGFAAELAAAGTDPVALQALVDSLASNDNALAAAVAANTPVVPPAA